jgi:thioredoxin reductase (NADPH)
MPNKNHYQVAIIGSGPAGLTAAIYAARAQLEPLVLEGTQPGGQLTITSEVENFPGFEEGIQGPELMDIIRKQAQRFGAESVYRTVTSVDFGSSPYKVTLDNGDIVESRAVVISTGSSAMWLGLEGETRLQGKGVSACATCDGFFFRDEEVVVVGGGDTAMEEALYLTKFASRVTVVHRRDELRASKVMQDRAFANDKIHFEWDSVITGLVGEEGVSGVQVKNVRTGDEKEIPATGYFAAIGHKPNTSIFEGILDMEDTGYLKTHDDVCTNVEGVFACGDVQDHTYRQAITAAGSGCMAAIRAERWLAERGIE